MHLTWRSVSLIAMLGLLVACGKATGQPDEIASSTSTAVPPTSTSTFSPVTYPFPFTDASAAAINACGSDCFSPQQVQTFYNLTPLYEQGYFGQGTTIAIIGGYGSPTLKNDLHTFDQTFGLPDPPRFDILSPLGDAPIPPGWGLEETLDVEWAHAIAPGANIVLLLSPVLETTGIAGFPEIGKLLTYIMDNHLAQIVSLSLAAGEPTFDGDPCQEGLGNGQDFLKQFDETILQRAAEEKISIFASAGNSGSTTIGCQQDQYLSFQSVNWPASDPYVTAVGGTVVQFQDSTGAYGSETAWPQGGGGLSQFYSEPDWQKNLSIQPLLNGKRGLPDVAACSTANYILYQSFDGGNPWVRAGGTSQAAPQWAGLTAIFDQMAGEPLGLLNPALYQLAGQGFHDITSGDNSYYGVPGYSAGQGWDMITGWGSPDAATLAPLLVSTAKQLEG